MGLLFRLASQFVAGETIEDAVSRAREVNSRGMHALINFLGEHYTEMSQVEAVLGEYRQLMARIQEEGLDASISVKPTQTGLELDEALCLESMRHVAREASERDVFLWIDMESSDYTDATLRIYRDLLRESEAVGVCLQANLHRTTRDLPELAREGGVIRLVKGAYREPRRLAFTERAAIDENFGRLLDLLFQEGNGFAVGTHDGKFVDRVLRLSETYEKDFEFQMLLGVRDPLKADLAKKGYRVAEYIPYGPAWLPYFSRRLRERPQNIITTFQSFLDTGH